MVVNQIYQFRAHDADIVLLSDDSEKFYVHRCILATASPFFEHMFTLPQPLSLDAEMDSSHMDNSPVIPVSESRSTLDALLRFVYPVPDPVIASLDELGLVLTAAVKYDFIGVISALRRVLLTPDFLRENPTRVFAIACRYELDYETKIASQHTLSVNVLDCPLSDDLKFITAHSYHRLLDLHRRRATAAQQVLKITDDVKCMQCNSGAHGMFVPPRWWKEFERMAKEELALRPTSDVIFGMAFLAKVAEATGCPRCAGSMMDSHLFLDGLKKQIDELPATI
ncbi:hypothetical protein BJ138DRAFT_594278 [Hygrophoropsis aurantiaca]|uniref:Uncharacterized protein n=1 Tax=Hygrophoropsis aurantiaca TaxID=72124 RepID=A0ACB8ASW3_9AGAM|nr:hypothetical protein BJ138DRAFT_594278 [Hygrophoropsis aurantiaca]